MLASARGPGAWRGPRPSGCNPRETRALVDSPILRVTLVACTKFLFP